MYPSLVTSMLSVWLGDHKRTSSGPYPKLFFLSQSIELIFLEGVKCRQSMEPIFLEGVTHTLQGV